LAAAIYGGASYIEHLTPWVVFEMCKILHLGALVDAFRAGRLTVYSEERAPLPPDVGEYILIHDGFIRVDDFTSYAVACGVEVLSLATQTNSGSGKKAAFREQAYQRLALEYPELDTMPREGALLYLTHQDRRESDRRLFAGSWNWLCHRPKPSHRPKGRPRTK
jgi:hypothetical protein